MQKLHYRRVTYKKDGCRFFGITEVTYGFSGKLDWYNGDEAIIRCLNTEELNHILKQIKKAIKLPIIDIDNWPNEYKDKK